MASKLYRFFRARAFYEWKFLIYFALGMFIRLLACIQAQDERAMCVGGSYAKIFAINDSICT